jgi:restriction system protein
MIHIDYTELIRISWIAFIKPFWWFWVIIFSVPVVISIAELYIRKRLDKRWLEKHKRLIEWKTMNPKKFERIVAIIFEGLGYKTKVVGGSGDEGIDIIAHKDGKRFFIQCKRKDRVPPKEVREFAGSIRDLKENEKGFLVTTGGFTEEGKVFAKDNPIEIELIDGFRLERLAKEIKK